MLTQVFFIALINWLVVTIFVESHLFAPYRDRIVLNSQHARLVDGSIVKLPYTFPEGTSSEDAAAAKMIYLGPWARLAQLVTCHLCMAVWVGFAEAFYFGGPNQGWAKFIANGLLYAAGGHLILELRSRIAKVDPVPLEDADQQ